MCKNPRFLTPRFAAGIPTGQLSNERQPTLLPSGTPVVPRRFVSNPLKTYTNLYMCAQPGGSLPLGQPRAITSRSGTSPLLAMRGVGFLPEAGNQVVWRLRRPLRHPCWVLGQRSISGRESGRDYPPRCYGYTCFAAIKRFTTPCAGEARSNTPCRPPNVRTKGDKRQLIRGWVFHTIMLPVLHYPTSGVSARTTTTTCL
jgi:hypothetical protein